MFFNKKKNNPDSLLNLQRQKDKSAKKMQKWIEDGNMEDCPTCNGEGKLYKHFGGYKAAEVCNDCNGLGKIYK